MAQTHQPSLLEKLTLLPKILSIALGSTVYYTATYFLGGGVKARSAVEHVVYGIVRGILNSVTTGQEQITIQPTQASYEAKCKALGVSPQIDTLHRGVKCYWLGSKAAEKTILYFHGGGFVLSGGPGHFALLHELQVGLSSASGKSVCVVAVDYTLAPHARYPAQLQEAADSLQWLITDLGKKPSDIVVAGDSAGGNIVLALLSHLLHPHPSITTTINLTEPFSSAVLISPWCSFDVTHDSYERYAASDLIGSTMLQRWSSLFMGDAKADEYNQPTRADANWFKNIDSQVKHILVWAGGAEILLDGILKVAKLLEAVHSSTTTIVEPGAPHEAMLIDKLVGYRKHSEGQDAIQSFILKSF